MTHRSSLRANRHHAKHLQRAWNKYGEKAFQLVILQICPPDRTLLLQLEASWMGTLPPCFNSCPVPGSPLGLTHTVETKKKISIAALGKKRTPEQCANIALGQVGRKHSRASRMKSSKARTGRVLSPAHRAAISRGKRGKS